MNEAEQLAALEQRLLAKEQAIAQLEAMPDVGYSSLTGGAKQLAFDIPVGVARAGAGLADVLSYPIVKGLEYAGAPVETFGLSKLLSAGTEQVAPTLGVQPETGTQELVSFLTPSPLSKAKLLSQAGTGLASYLGMQGAEAVAPESQYAGLVGALAGPSIATLSGKAVGAAAPKLEDIGLGLQRKARGITKADYKNAKNAVIETVDGEFSTQLKESADNLIKNKTLGTSRNPGDMYANLQAAKESTENAIQSVLKSTEAQIGPVPPPTFDNTLNYIKNNIDSAEVDSYLAYLANKQSSLAREGQGSLTYLNQQKKVVGESWKNSPLSDAGFWRTLYRDMKQHIEKYAPEVKDLNKKKQDLVVVEPIVTRNFKASGGDFDIGAAQRLLNTTGGAGLAGGAILGAATGNVKRGLLGALTLRGLATPTGQDIVGRGLRAGSSLAEVIGKLGFKIDAKDLGVLQRGGIAEGFASIADQTAAEILSAPEPDTLEDIQAQREKLKAALQNLTVTTEPTLQPKTVKVGKQNVSIPTGEEYAPPSLVKAVMKVESAGKQESISPKGATGLMQLMPATAKDLGVDPTNAQENVEGGSRYLQQLISKYGKTDIGLAAYNWGQGNVDKAIRKLKAERKAVTWANIMQVVKVPMETRLYVNKVLKNREVEA
jgi:hypothetical protein